MGCNTRRLLRAAIHWSGLHRLYRRGQVRVNLMSSPWGERRLNADARRYMVIGISPYQRITYRYSPVVAASLIPNVSSQFCFGKLCFVVGDFLTGRLVLEVLNSFGSSHMTEIASVTCWLFNPFTLTISTRGSFESAVSTGMLSILQLIMYEKTVLACALLGFVIHLRIYPVIYVIPLCCFLCLDCNSFCEHSKQQGNYGEWARRISNRFDWGKKLFTRLPEVLTLIISFLSFWMLCFVFFGSDFQNETYSYHVGRKDVRHNFSPMFYVEYIAPRRQLSTFYKIVSILPQIMTVTVVGFKFAKDLPFCLLMQTIGFVALNKVSTAQYFIWYMCLIPTAIPSGIVQCSGCKSLANCAGQDLHRAGGLRLWLSSQFIWLISAYRVEFCGEGIFHMLWFASLIFLFAQTFLGTHFITMKTKFVH